MSTRKTKVLMYYTFEDKIGGPLIYIRSIINSELKEEYEFVTCFQNMAPGGLNVSLLKRMVQQIKKASPDIVHVHGLQSEGFYGVLAAKLAGCRCIITTVHGFAFDGQKKYSLKWLMYRYLVEPLTLRLSNKVYCVCQYASERSIISKNTSANNCGYIHNAAGELNCNQSRNQVREKFGIRPNETVFIIAGRVSKDKGFDILAQAIKLLNNSTTHKFRLMVVGDGEYMEDFRTNMSNEIASNQVIIVGQTNNVADYLGASDIFVLPSYHENLPIALLEAGKMGLPCIASNVGGISEIIENEKTGFLICNKQAESYAQKMEILMSDTLLCHRMGKAMQEDINRRFSMSLMCSRIKELYIDGMRKKDIKD